MFVISATGTIMMSIAGCKAGGLLAGKGGHYLVLYTLVTRQTLQDVTDPR